MEERGITQGPAARPSCSAQGQEASESHGKKLNRAEANRMTAVPICSAPLSAEGFVCVMPLVLGATGEKKGSIFTPILQTVHGV